MNQRVQFEFTEELKGKWEDWLNSPTTQEFFSMIGMRGLELKQAWVSQSWSRKAGQTETPEEADVKAKAQAYLDIGAMVRPVEAINILGNMLGDQHRRLSQSVVGPTPAPAEKPGPAGGNRNKRRAAGARSRKTPTKKGGAKTDA